MTQALHRGDYEPLRRCLSDDTLYLKLAMSFIDRSAAESCDGDRKFEEYYKLASQVITEENAAEIRRLAGSPIEKIFLNSLLLTFIKNDGLGLLIHSTDVDAATEIDNYRLVIRRWNEFFKWFNKNKPTPTVEEFLDGEVRRGAMSSEERRHQTRLIFRYGHLSHEDSYHMTLQPRFPHIKIDSKGIRPDIYFWIPSRPDIKIVVECDGFAYHSDKATFRTDPQRDRALKALGYDVLRFSGSEIFNDPINAPHELAKYLLDRRERRGPSGSGRSLRRAP